MENNNENVSFFICDDNNDNNDIIQEQYGFLFNSNCNNNYDNNNNSINDTYIYNTIDSDAYLSRSINYETNFTVKELILIADYYGLAKNLKNSRATKVDIINSILNYELNPHNFENVTTRERMWFYVNELKNNKYMKKYILWQ